MNTYRYANGGMTMNGKQYFDGKEFQPIGKYQYYRETGNFKNLMHRYVWEFYNGKIPDGYEIHHKDGDHANNTIENLQCLSKVEHQKLHSENLSEEKREWYRKNLAENARPKASEWHRSDEGREWHKEQYERTKEALHKKVEKTCVNCGKVFLGHSTSKYCSNACKSAYRRKTGSDLAPAICVCCGKYFKTNKFSPSRTCSRSCANKQRAIDKNRRGH